MQNRSPILLATIILGLLAIGGVAFMFMQPPPAPPQDAVPVATPTPVPVAIYVANRDIPPRTVVTQAMVRRTLISGAAPADAITDLNEIRSQLTKEPIRVGETVTLASFAPRLRRKVDANFEIPSGYRAVAIWVDPKQTAAGLVDVGDRVDVVATHRLRIDKAPKQFVVGAMDFSSGRMIAQNLRVLAVDDSINAPPPTPTPVPNANPNIDPAGGPAPAPTPAPQAPGAAQPGAETKTRVLLAATPDVATRLIAANDMGTLNVIIRNPEDADANPVPEMREYPSRTFVSNDSENGGSGGGSRGGNNVESLRAIPTLPPPLSPERVVEPQSPATMPDVAAPVDNSKEITVIRGTEKTRVIVPQR
jgi:Flp pilus assembly protein CpaB